MAERTPNDGPDPEPDHGRTLADDLLLLCWDEAAGRPASRTSTALDHGIGGALLLELALRGRLTVGERKRPTVDATVTGIEVLDAVAAEVRTGSARRNLKGWVRRLSSRDRRRRVVARQVERGVLVPEQRRLLGLVPVTRHRVADPARLDELRARVRAALESGAVPDERTAALVGLAGACDALVPLYPRSERRKARKRALELADQHPASAATQAVVQETQAAVIAAVAAAGATASSG